MVYGGEGESEGDRQVDLSDGHGEGGGSEGGRQISDTGWLKYELNVKSTINEIHRKLRPHPFRGNFRQFRNLLV